VRRLPAIAVVLASPFTAWNFLAGQNGFLTGSLFGAALYCLEERPVLAGVFIGALTCKPQFGILFPVALLAARQWRAMASAALTAAALAGLSVAAFGAGAWQMLPRALLAQQKVVLLADGQAAADWGRIQTVYGLVRDLHGGAVLAWSLQGATALGLAALVWRVWRSPARYALKAASLSAAALIATPYAFSYDMAALAVPVAFLAADQLRHGPLHGEQASLLALFGMVVAALFGFGDSPGRLDFGSLPLAPFIVIALLALILRRVRRPVDESPGRNFSRSRVFALAAHLAAHGDGEEEEAGVPSHG
jgi:arabinofuranan 3-O-arabinosyltransferase